MFQDCRSKRPGHGGPAAVDCQKKIDEEYLSLMAELGEGPEPNPSQIHSNMNRNNFSNLFDRSNQHSRSVISPSPLQNNWNSGNSAIGGNPPPLMSNPPVPGINLSPPQLSPLHSWSTPQNQSTVNISQHVPTAWVPPPLPPIANPTNSFWPPLPPNILPPPPPPES